MPPSGYAYPASLERLTEVLRQLLPDSVVHVSFEVYENTSDVIIMSDSWRTAVDLWHIRIIAVKENDLENVQIALIRKGFSALKAWLTGANDDLHQRPDVWIQHAVTFRYEQGDLLHDICEADHPWRRPPPLRPMP